jgi:hypothetical protein
MGDLRMQKKASVIRRHKLMKIKVGDDGVDIRE